MNETLKRAVARERSLAYRDRRRQGHLLVPVAVSPAQLAALERLALLEAGDRDKTSIACSVARFLDAAPHISALGDALWPATQEIEGST